MKVSEVIKVCEKQLIAPSSFDKAGSPLKLRSMWKNTNYGKPQKATAQTVTVKSTGKGGQIYGRRTIMQK